MINVKHFKEERTDQSPRWADAGKFMSEIGRERIISVNSYPTGPQHNLVVVYEEPEPEPEKE